MIFSLIDILAVLLPILLVVAFVTLLERKVLGSMQRRVGPDTVGIYGILQPFSDALKLLVKETIIPQQSQKSLFFLAPAVALTCGLLAWGVIPFGPGLVIADVELGWLFSLAASSVAIYGVLFAGWASNSAYSLIGGLRSCAVLISYELALSGAALGSLFLVGSFSLTTLSEYQESIWLALPLLPLLLIFLITCLAELSRTPFDLQEAESELVAGFMTEYSAFVFVAFFLFEYTSIVVLSSLTAILFFGGFYGILPNSIGTWIETFTPYSNHIIQNMSSSTLDIHIPLINNLQIYFSSSAIIIALKSCCLMFGVIWVRGTLPRMRYDQLQVLCWTILLPLIFALLVVVLSLGYAFDSFII